MDCGHPLRDGPCAMEKNHRGRHTTVAFTCDNCNRSRRGSPQLFELGEDDFFAVCWMCRNVAQRNDYPIDTYNYEGR